MIRIFTVHSNPIDGTHVHLVLTGHAWKDTLPQLRKRYEHSSAAGKPLFFDYGTGSDLLPLAKITSEFGPAKRHFIKIGGNL